MKRTISITIEPEFFESGLQAGEEFQRAIGYLLTWAPNGPIESVKATVMPDGYIEASYYRAGQALHFVMGAVRRDDGQYSFHSQV